MAKNILITGSAGNIGGAIARALAVGDVKIALHYNSSEKRVRTLEREIKLLGADAFIIQADISKSDAAKSLVERATEKMGGLDILIHAAAIFGKTPFDEVSESSFDEIISVNLKAAFFIAQTAARVMQKNGGKMLFISDLAAQKPYGGYLPYSISKAGVDALVKGLAKTLAPKIQVNAIAPYVVTKPKDITEKVWLDLINKTPARRAVAPEEIVGVVKMILESGPTLTGQVITIDGGRMLG